MLQMRKNSIVELNLTLKFNAPPPSPNNRDLNQGLLDIYFTPVQALITKNLDG